MKDLHVYVQDMDRLSIEEKAVSEHEALQVAGELLRKYRAEVEAGDYRVVIEVLN